MNETPKLFTLEEPHVIDRNFKEAKSRFWELAKSRVKLASQEEHEAFHKEHCPDNEVPTDAIFILQKGISENSDDPEKAVLGLEININKDFFGEVYADLIPYVVEHEIYEAWLHSKRGYNPTNKEHALARRRQIKMAMRDGKAERLVKFFSEKLPSLKEEFEDAYQRIREKE